MRTIATLQEPDTGSITLGEIDVLSQKDETRKILGYLPQEFGVYPKVSAEVLLDHLAVLKGIGIKKERKLLVQSLLHKTNLFDARRKNLGGYSGGMKQRFGIAQALLADPKIIILITITTVFKIPLSILNFFYIKGSLKYGAFNHLLTQ